jgi:hypothetical protein
MKSNEVESLQLVLQQRIDDLEKQRRKALIEEGKAYNCKTCKTFVDKEKVHPSQAKTNLCCKCYSNYGREERRKDLVNKLKYGRVVDVDIEYSGYEIKGISIVKAGMRYLVKSNSEDDDGKMFIDSEDKDQGGLEIPEVRPWQKPRPEKPLLEKKP